MLEIQWGRVSSSSRFRAVLLQQCSADPSPKVPPTREPEADEKLEKEGSVKMVMYVIRKLCLLVK